MGFLKDQVGIGDDVVAVLVDGQRVTLRMSKVVLDIHPDELGRVIDMLYRAQRLVRESEVH